MPFRTRTTSKNGVFPSGSWAWLLLCLLPRESFAAALEPEGTGRTEARRHRLTLSTGLGATFVAPEVTGSDPDVVQGILGVPLEGRYAFLIVKGIEIGGTVTYWFRPDGIHAFLPTATLFPHLSLGSSSELGMLLRGGGVVVNRSGRGTWTGWSMGVGPEIRKWVGKTIAWHIAVTYETGGPDLKRFLFVGFGCTSGVTVAL